MSMEKFINTEQEKVRDSKIKILEDMKISAYGNKQIVNTEISSLKKKYLNKTKLQLTKIKNDYKIMGRIILKRDQGKAGFFVIKDYSDQIQCYIRQDNLTEKEWKVFKTSDIGDIIWISGKIMKTNHDELTIKIFKYKHIVKSIKVLPEKYHGLQDVEERYRNRHVDLIVNSDVKKRFIIRSKIIYEIRNFLNSLNYIEVETPYLHPILGGANARPFKTHHNSLSMDLYLRVAPELYLKKLIIGGYDAVYEIGKNFRNEGIDIKHNPEFTSIELYKANANYLDMINITEKMLKYVAKKLDIKSDFKYLEKTINFFGKWHKDSMVNLVKKYTNFDFLSKEFSLENAIKYLKNHKIEIAKHEKTYGHILNLFFENFVEEKLIHPTFVIEYPVEISPLSKACLHDLRFTERFELYIAGFELANAFSELNDPYDQYNRFKLQLNEKKEGNLEANEMDESFIIALLQGLPPTGGLGIGIDRLVMLLTNCSSIREVIIFPHLRNKQS